MRKYTRCLSELAHLCALGCLAAVPVLLSGCTPQDTASAPESPVGPAYAAPEVEDPVVSVPDLQPVAPRREMAGLSTRRKPIWTEIFDGSRGTILILGGIHGNEPVSSELMTMLSDHLKTTPGATMDRRVILVNAANPDGLADNTRANSRGVDLNRNFPARNFAPSHRHGPRALSEPETRALRELVLRYEPDVVVSVHGPLDCIDPDGGENSQRLARAMALESPLKIDDLEAFPGSMGSYCGETLGLAMITYELDRKDRPADLENYLRPHLAAMLVAIRETPNCTPARGR